MGLQVQSLILLTCILREMTFCKKHNNKMLFGKNCNIAIKCSDSHKCYEPEIFGKVNTGFK